MFSSNQTIKCKLEGERGGESSPMYWPSTKFQYLRTETFYFQIFLDYITILTATIDFLNQVLKPLLLKFLLLDLFV